MASTSVQQSRSAADIYKDIQALSAPIAGAAENKIKSLSQAYRPIDPALLNQALAEGGSLSQSVGINGSDFWAMTPETFKAEMASRVPVGKRIAEATQISDMVSGNSVNRQALERSALAESANAQQAIGQAMSVQQQELGRAQQGEQFNQTMKLSRERMDRELMVMKDSLALADQQGGQPTKDRPFLNSALGLQYSDNIATTTKAGKSLDLPAFENYAKAKAYSGAKLGEVINVEDVAPDLQGDWFTKAKVPYKHMLLTNEGWYGFNEYIKNQDGSLTPDARTASPAAIIPIAKDSKYGSKGGSGSGTNSTLVNKYGQSNDLE